MSMSTNIVYGYGFTAADISDAKLRDFILSHANTIRKNHEDYAGELLDFAKNDFSESVESAFPDIMCEMSLMEGALAVVSNAMSEETGIRFCYQPGQDDCGSLPTILFANALPWMFNPIEKSLTAEKLDEILTKYMTELGIDDKPGYVFVEYYH